MAKKRSSARNYSMGGTAMEGYIRNLTLGVDQPEIDITTLGDDGPRSLIDNYRWRHEMDGFADFAAGASDAVLAGMIGDEDGVASDDSPTGAGAGADDPHYTGQETLSSYRLTSGVGGVTSFQATTSGASALTRAVA